jgi:hypothetical protein
VHPSRRPGRTPGPWHQEPRPDLATRLGLDNVYADHPGRYPHIDLSDLEARKPSLIVLPDEPYPFSPEDGPEMFPAHRTALVKGRDLTWYGPSLVTARPALLAAINQETERPIHADHLPRPSAVSASRGVHHDHEEFDPLFRGQSLHDHGKR